MSAQYAVVYVGDDVEVLHINLSLREAEDVVESYKEAAFSTGAPGGWDDTQSYYTVAWMRNAQT